MGGRNSKKTREIGSRWESDGNEDTEEGGSQVMQGLHGHRKKSGFYFKCHVMSSDL